VESIGDAIAEGRGRATDKDFAHFITTAIASATEAEHHLLRALDLRVLTEDVHSSLREDLIRSARFSLDSAVGCAAVELRGDEPTSIFATSSKLEL
jgi:hypothetical protein